MPFHYITYLATPYHKNSCPGDHEIYNFGGPFLGHHYYILSLCDLCLGVEKYFYYITYTATPQHKIPHPRGQEIYNSGRSFLSHHNHALSLSESCILKKIIRNNAISLYDLCGYAIPKNPCPGGHEIYNCGRHFLGHHYYTLSLYGSAQEQIKKIFRDTHQFYTFYPKITSPWGGVGGYEFYNFLSPYPTDATYQIQIRQAQQIEIMQFPCMFFMAMPYQRTPAPGS